jgi:hypothetical protein
MISYYQFVPGPGSQEEFDATALHVTEHLSSVADEDDNPNTHAGSVNISIEPAVRESDGMTGFIIQGYLDADPVAPYLREDFNPEDDIANNPLSVPSILDNKTEGGGL